MGRKRIEKTESDSVEWPKAGFLSLSLHVALAVLLTFSLQPARKERMSVYRVTLRPFSPPGGIQSVDPGGGSQNTFSSLSAEPIKPDKNFKESKIEGKSKTDKKVEKLEEILQTVKSQKKHESLAKHEIETVNKSLSGKREKLKKEKESAISLQRAIEDIHKKVALDKIQKKVASRERLEEQKTERQLAARQRTAGQKVSNSSPNQTGLNFKTGSDLVEEGGIGRGYGPGIGPGVGGYLIGGVPWGSPQGSTFWDSKWDNYCSKVWAKIKKGWTLPENLPKGKTGLEAIIVIIIERDGKIQKSWFEKKSGNIVYDQMAMRAIKKAEPFPPIPKEFSDRPFEIGIRFHPD